VNELEHSGIDLAAEDPMPLPATAHSPVTLEELHRLVLDELGLSVSSAGRPATFEPLRASRDPETWTALSTYGHPRLDSELKRLAATWESDRSAIVVAEHPSGPASLVRADRTPPQALRELAELRSVGPPEARGEAEELATRLAGEEAARRSRLSAELLQRRRARWEVGVRERFKQLVQDTVVAELAVRHAEPDGLDPTVIWLELGRDTTTGWAYAETFRLRLGIQLGELVPQGLASEVPTRRARESGGTRAENGRALLELMAMWRERAAPAGG